MNLGPTELALILVPLAIVIGIVLLVVRIATRSRR